MQRRSPRRIATISLHTSPLDQPGTGDAGGLNVYVVEVSKRLAERGVEVEIFTRAVCPDTPPTVELAPGVLVRNVVAGPFEELDKTALAGQICEFTFGVLRTEADFAPGRYDLLHAHYWLSGQVGAVAAERWGVPLVQSMHTLGKVKNLALADGDCAEPAARIRGEGEVIAAADRLVANTAEEARQLIELYGADPWRVETVNPGVDLSVFRPARQPAVGPPQARAAAGRGRAGLRRPDPAAEGTGCRPARGGRAADGLPRAGGPAGGGHRGRPERIRGRRPGPAGGHGRAPGHLGQRAGWSRRARRPSWPTGTAPRTWFWCRRTRSRSGWWRSRLRRAGRRWWRPSVGGLRTAVRDGYSGVLVDGHDPVVWAQVLAGLLGSPRRLESLSRGARKHASGFGWPTTADRLTDVYTGAMNSVRYDAPLSEREVKPCFLPA